MSIQKYLQNPPVLMLLVPGKPLILYLSVNPSSMGCLLAQEGDKGVEKAIYYLSKKMVGCEEHYTAPEKTCWALVWASKKLRHYMLAYPVKLISRMDPLKYLFEKSALTAANQKGYRIGVLLITPDGSHIPPAFKLNFDVTNNQAEYEACVVGMEAALTLSVEKLEVIGDSNLVVSQANGDWKVREERLKLYH
ncbi:hypothetical protein RHMOL_Rhmol07G0204200 [Rhododendron molle]|uniref:Uncharacterized protein n=1 Tax=Rhododendron molle TaxID=49168 RepID=A0ACC0N2R0_RHOML|nr:hypothetical protein RHMOL_Rhmol07G0204200 [Rhododendron molle]